MGRRALIKTVPGVHTLKRYNNRRLYDTELASYVNLAYVRGLVGRFVSFVVLDAKTGADLTESTTRDALIDENYIPTAALVRMYLDDLKRKREAA